MRPALSSSCTPSSSSSSSSPPASNPASAQVSSCLLPLPVALDRQASQLKNVVVNFPADVEGGKCVCCCLPSLSLSLSHPPVSPQQLQSLTLRPPPPGALAIPSSLRFRSPSSAPPPLSRPLFPPLRPRPQPGNKAAESLATPCRHLSVPPPSTSPHPASLLAR